MFNENKYNILEIVNELETQGRFKDLKRFKHHGKVTVYQHCLEVAKNSYKFALKHNLKVDYYSLIRGALLHDYYLYDWHESDSSHRLHGFRHSKIALRNAMQDFELTDIEKDIIMCHMFPLTYKLPCTKEGKIVCMIDKVCAVKDYI